MTVRSYDTPKGVDRLTAQVQERHVKFLLSSEPVWVKLELKSAVLLS